MEKNIFEMDLVHNDARQEVAAAVDEEKKSHMVIGN